MANEINTITKLENKLIQANSLIISERPTSKDYAFVHTILCQVGLPRSKVEGEKFERKNGKASLLVTAGSIWDGNKFVQQGVPYGTFARLVLAYLSSYAVKFKTKEINIGRSTREFLSKINTLDDGRNYQALWKQVTALAACRIQLGYETATYNGQPIATFDAWVTTNDKMESLWPGVITLSSDFYNTLSAAAVPIDFRAYLTLKKSALQMDIYTMLVHRLFRIEGKPIFIPWQAVKNQFGQEYKTAKDFKRAFVDALKAALIVYPQAKVEVVNGGLQLSPSPPPISKM